MSRTIQDADLQLWEAYASAGDFGFPERSRIVFHCLSDRSRRARYVDRETDKAGTETEVVRLPQDELVALLGQGRDLS